MKNNTHQTWTPINDIINKKKPINSLPNTLNHDNEDMTDPVEIANKFNEYFTNVGPTLSSKIPPVNTSSKSFLNKTHYYESFFIDPVTEEDVEKGLRGLNPNKSIGHD